MHLLHTIKSVLLIPIHPKGWPFILLAAAVTGALFLFAGEAGWIGGIGLLFCVYFFRNPNRRVPQGAGFILATGDGVISHITQTSLPKELGDPSGALYHKVSIFLNVFNVHVNRVPATGRIVAHRYIPGKFVNAALDKASDDNERTVTLLETAQGEKIGFAQIAGLVARRIVCDLTVAQSVTQGTRYGIIRFGSRCDIYIPLNYSLLVGVDSTAIGGETMLAIDSNHFQASRLTWITS